MEQLIDKVIAVIIGTEKKVNIIFLIYLFMLHDHDKTAFQLMMSDQYSDFDEIAKVDKIDRNFLERVNSKTINFIEDGFIIMDENVNNQLSLKTVLEVIYKSSKLNQQQRGIEIKSLHYDDCDHGTNEQRTNASLIEVYEKEDDMQDYKNWIELATSFDA